MKILKKQIYITILCISAIIFFYFFQIHNNELNIQAKAAIYWMPNQEKSSIKKMKIYLLHQRVCRKW